MMRLYRGKRDAYVLSYARDKDVVIDRRRTQRAKLKSLDINIYIQDRRRRKESWSWRLT